MSYWDLPRFHILGTFYADPPTSNNDPSHYDPACTRPSPWQDPRGTHSFKFVKVNVTAAMDVNGNLVTSGDPLIGATASSVDTPTAARLVDLDVYQQGVSQIWGMQMQIAVGGGSLAGTIDTPALNSLRFSRVLPTRGWQSWDAYGWGSYGGDTNAVGFFQSVLRVPAASWPAGSAILDQLRAKTITDPAGNILVSFRMVLDAYQNVPEHADFRTGRILATLGPVLNANEPDQAPNGRWLNAPQLPPTAPWYYPQHYNAPFQFAARDGGVQTVVVDLANALATQTPGGQPVDLGNLSVQIGNLGSVGPFQCNESLYANLGGIIEIPVSAQQFQAAQPVNIVTDMADIGGPTLWSEDPSGVYFAADERVLRMTSEPGSAQRTATTRVYATKFGVPLANYQLGVEVVSVVNGINGATVPWSAGYKGNTPQAQGALTAGITATDANGWATVNYAVQSDPGFRTTQLDGQLYFVLAYDPAAGPPPDLTKVGPNQEQCISVVAWSSYTVNENPEWTEIQNMMIPYVKLYPAMTTQIDLSDFHAFQIFSTNPPWQFTFKVPPYQLPNGKTIAAGAIPFYMTRDLNDPRLMPIPRDLSPNKLLTVLYFVYNVIQQTVQPPSTAPGSGTGANS